MMAELKTKLSEDSQNTTVKVTNLDQHLVEKTAARREHVAVQKASAMETGSKSSSLERGLDGRIKINFKDRPGK